MIKLYKTNRDLQLEWMKNNPGKTIAINVVGVVAIFAYYEWQARKFEKQLKTAREKLDTL